MNIHKRIGELIDIFEPYSIIKVVEDDKGEKIITLEFKEGTPDEAIEAYNEMNRLKNSPDYYEPI